MKILITGHKGFVGKYFVQKYKDHDITGIDISDGIDVRDFFKTNNQKFDLVIHLAAIVGGRATIEGNPLLVASDLSIDAELVQWVMRTQPERLVYFSSSAAYPTKYQTHQKSMRLSEGLINFSDISSPDLTYGWSKLSGEYLCSFIDQRITKVHIFRPFSGYGSDQSLDYPFSSFIQRAKENKSTFEIWGDGAQVRDWIHVLDIVNAVDAALTYEINIPVNLGSGIPTSFNELASLVIRLSKSTSTVVYNKNAPTGVEYRVSDNSRMRTFYAPKISLQDGIEMALRDV